MTTNLYGPNDYFGLNRGGVCIGALIAGADLMVSLV
jgi:hypothetical protein